MSFKEIFKDCRIAALFDKPKIIGLIGDSNEGKSMAIYHILNELKKDFQFKVYSYGLRNKLSNMQQVYSIGEVEQVKNSIIFIDEFDTLFDLENRKEKRRIEKTLRLIFHNNNILLLCGVPENFKKFISAKLSVFIFKKIKINDLINGSGAKNAVLSYRGDELGSSVLNIPVDKALIFDGNHYETINIPYIKELDTKDKNVPIIVSKIVQKEINLNTFEEMQSV